MDHDLEGWVGHNHLIESISVRDVFDDDEIELGFGDIGVIFKNILALLLRANAGDNRVAVLEEEIDDVDGYEAA